MDTHPSTSIGSLQDRLLKGPVRLCWGTNCKWLVAENTPLDPWVSTVVYVHGEEITTSILDYSERGRVRSSLISSDHIVVVSKFTLNVTKELIGEKFHRKLCLIQNGVDINKFRPGARSDALKKDYGLENSTFVFVSVSRLVEKKGHDKTIVAFKSVQRKFPDSLLLIIGDGPQRKRLEEMISNLELMASVRLIGSVPEDELVDHYRLGDVFIMPNRALPDGDTEGFGLVFLEANGCGLPVIAGMDGGSLEAVTDRFNGLVVDGNSENEIAEAMLTLRQDAALRSTLRANGLSRACEFDWGSRAEMFRRLCLRS